MPRGTHTTSGPRPARWVASGVLSRARTGGLRGSCQAHPNANAAPPWPDLVAPLSCRAWPSDRLTVRGPHRVFEVAGGSVARVFICYRREDAPATTGRIYDHLVQTF